MKILKEMKCHYLENLLIMVEFCVTRRHNKTITSKDIKFETNISEQLKANNGKCFSQ